MLSETDFWDGILPDLILGVPVITQPSNYGSMWKSDHPDLSSTSAIATVNCQVAFNTIFHLIYYPDFHEKYTISFT